MKHPIWILLIIAGLISCNRHSEQWETIVGVEFYIEENPDSALAVLEQVDVSKLTSREEKAKHALLYSMALDKNYIDKTDFEILQPAIDYYEDNGTATDKLRTNYYRGRIFRNQGNDAVALRFYVKALEEGESSTDNLTKARVLVAQSIIYNSLMKWDKVCDVNNAAAAYYYELGRIDNYINCLLRCIGAYIQTENYNKAKDLLDKCYQYADKTSEPVLSQIYSYHLMYLSSIKDRDGIQPLIDEYKSRVSENNIDYLEIAGTYADAGAYEKAESIIVNIDTNSVDKRNLSLKYYAISLDIYEHLGDYKKAYELYKKFNELNDSVVFSILENDTLFIEEKYTLEMQNLEERESKNRVIMLMIIIAVTLITVIIYIRGKLKIRTIKQIHAEKETERYRLLYEQIEQEKDNLTELLSQNKDISNNIRDVVTKRIELLNKFFRVYITNNSDISRKVDKELDELLADKESFMTSTHLAFTGCHPNFIKYLEAHNLTEREIEYCCLYALGLKGKEVRSYIKMPSLYNISSDIRKKLGLVETDTNLGIYIRKLLDSM